MPRRIGAWQPERPLHGAAQTVGFAVVGSGTVKYLVTDLAAGTWQVWREGKIVRPAVRVAESEGTLYFEGPPGNYQLRR